MTAEERWSFYVFILVASAVLAGMVYVVANTLLGLDAQRRDSSVRERYLRSIGLDHTPPGCQVDHLVSLHCQGPDTVENVGLVCGPLLPIKERVERDCEKLKRWLAE